MKHLTNLLIFSLLTFFTNSCEENNDPYLAKDFKQGSIINAGEFESDGCGWLIKIDSTYFYPANLSKDLHENDLEVLVSFKILEEKVGCGFPSSTTPQYSKIKILEIISK